MKIDTPFLLVYPYSISCFYTVAEVERGIS